MPQRLVFLGDSITDGHTLILQVDQALAAAGAPAFCYNAGVSGDRADQMRDRLSRDVLPLRPDVVLVSAGINDAIQGVSTNDYEDALIGIIATLRAAGVMPILMTPSALAPEHTAARALTQAYAGIQRQLACTYGLRVADVAAAMAAVRGTSTTSQLAPDGIHFEEPGYVAMAAAVLAALDQPHVVIPARPRWEPLPGLVTQWRLTGPDQAGPGLLWNIPETATTGGWWGNQERTRGYAQDFVSVLLGTTWIAEAELPGGPELILSVGGHVGRIDINGVNHYAIEGWRGWHVRPVLHLPPSETSRSLRLTVTGPFVCAGAAVEVSGLAGLLPIMEHA